MSADMTPSLPASIPTRRRTWLRAALLALPAIVFLWYFKVPALAFHWAAIQIEGGPNPATAIRVSDYRVGIERQPIEGLDRNASGLTFNDQRGTLFTVINRPPQVAELDTEGRLLRRIEIQGLKDPEGITYVEGDTYVISDEASHSLYWVEIGPDTRTLSVADASRLTLGMDVVNNASLEGVSWDARGQRLFVVKEKLPLRVLVITGLEAARRKPGFNVAINEWKPSTASTLFMSDLSSLTLHEPTGHMLLLSEQSALIVEYDPQGKPVDLLPLWRGFHGLGTKVPQPEGVAMGHDGSLFVLSEPNYFYRFDPPARPGWARPD
jgi:uncharacterized protein YjiK